MSGRNVLFFCDTSEEKRSFSTFWRDAILDGLRANGRNPVLLDLSNDDKAQKDCQQAVNEGVDFAMSLGTASPLITLTSGNYLLDELNVPCVSWFVDIMLSPNNIGLYMPLKHFLPAVLNEDEVPFCKVLNPKVRKALSVPLGGCFLQHEIDGNIISGGYKPLTERKYFISYTAKYYSVLDREWSELPKNISSMLNDIIDTILADPMKPILAVAQDIFNERQEQLEGLSFASFCLGYLNRVNLYLRSVLRLRILEAIVQTGIRVDIFGDGIFSDGGRWHDWRYADRVRLHPAVSYEGSLEIAEESQIVLNTGIFPGGMHDRVPAGMMAGAMVVTDPSTYLAKHFTDGEDVVTFDWQHLDELPHRMLHLWNHPDEMQGIARNGKRKAFAEHTWAHRVAQMIDVVERYKVTM